jgi:Lysylphosphatidylglycerol synthase TM region
VIPRRAVFAALRVAGYLLIAGFLGWQVWRVWSGLAQSLRTVGGTRIAVAVAVTSIAWVPGFVTWHLVLAGLGTRLPLAEAYRVRFLAMLTNYVPGGVWPAVALAVQAKQRGHSPGRFAAAFFGAQALTLLTGLVVGLLALPVLVTENAAWWLLLPAAAVGLAPVAAPGLLRAMLGGAQRLVRRGGAAVLLPDRRTLTVASGLAGVSWLLGGAHVAILAAAFGTDAWTAVAVGVGGFALSVVAGAAALVLPRGLGAREVALGLVLATVLAGPALVTVVALSRVVVVAADAVAAAIGFAVLFWQRRSARPSEPAGPAPPAGPAVPVGPAVLAAEPLRRQP